MLIESKIKRPSGSHIDIDGVDYHFKAKEADGPHVCEVTNPAHIQRFLAITEGYRIAEGGQTTQSESGAGDNSGTGEADPGDQPPQQTGDTGTGQDDGATKPDGAAGIKPMVLKNGAESVDLTDLNKKQLLAFAREAGFKVDAMSTAQALRESILQQATAAE